MHDFAADGVQHFLLHFIEQELGRVMHFAAVFAGRGLDQRAKLLQHVVGRFDEDRPVAQEAMAAVAAW